MTTQTIKRWGNSLAVRIPANLASEAQLAEDQEVDVRVEHGMVIVQPHAPIARFSRERLIQQFKESKLARHDDIDFGDPVGSELGGVDDPTRPNNT
jgi:antitoxin MazE